MSTEQERAANLARTRANKERRAKSRANGFNKNGSRKVRRAHLHRIWDGAIPESDADEWDGRTCQ